MAFQPVTDTDGKRSELLLGAWEGGALGSHPQSAEQRHHHVEVDGSLETVCLEGGGNILEQGKGGSHSSEWRFSCHTVGALGVIGITQTFCAGSVT